MNKRTIIYDFDGVIKESHLVKSDAFYDLYLPFGEDIAKKALEHHINNGGVSRFEKFKHYHKEFLGIILDENGVDEWAQKFSDIVKQKVIDCPFVSGAKDSIIACSRNYNQFIITGTPQKEMEDVLAVLGINEYFNGVFGSPENKIYWSKHLIETYDLISEDVVFIGDAKSDFDAAVAFNFHFLFRQHDENKAQFASYDIERIDDLDHLEHKLEKLWGKLQ